MSVDDTPRFRNRFLFSAAIQAFLRQFRRTQRILAQTVSVPATIISQTEFIMGEEKTPPSWWTTLPGVITALAGLLTAVGGLVLVLNKAGVIGTQKNAADPSVISSTLQTGDAKDQQASPKQPHKPKF